MVLNQKYAGLFLKVWETLAALSVLFYQDFSGGGAQDLR